ncbi:Calmodulin binding protein-like protein [Corchorus capsularis]|uniref:Calmodulin binding protein-like protein n=1 Tax=Corchorus capsularis TaxID=210143 RepID=A0A1R3IUR3_COCAP|nr:Calmodulin binding protein-like protein [Corchorus capsularis]
MLPSKRPAASDEDDERLGVMVSEPKRRATLKNAVRRSMMGLGGLSMNRIVLKLEPTLRLWVREAVESAIRSSFNPSSSRPSLNQIEPSRGRSLQLRFVDKLASKIFTGSKIEAEDGNPLRIVLFETTSNRIVSVGPLSSVKVEIVVLNGDFGADEREDWTENEFNASVLREREGKRPLVAGDLNVTLVDGVGTVDNVIFTDNSSWIRSRRFRLGAKVVQRISGDQVTIREARSGAFVVKDHRGELYKKHYPPHLRDEVWRLERIAKDGAFHTRLASNNISTVKDFLRLHVTDPSALRNILGGGISNRVWETIIEHARSCVVDDEEWYTYYGADQRVGLLLNSIYEVIAATFDGQSYQPVETLAFSQKLLVGDAKRQAYKNVRGLVLTDRRAIMGLSMPLTNLLPEPVSIPNLLQPQLDYSVPNQDQPETPLGLNQSSISYSYGVEDKNQSPVPLPQDAGLAIQAFNPMLRNSFRMGGMGIFPFNGESSLSFLPDAHFATEDNSEGQMNNWTSTWGQDSGFILSTDSDFESPLSILSSSPNFDVHSQRMGEGRDVCHRAGWLKIKAVIKWSLLLSPQSQTPPLGGALQSPTGHRKSITITTSQMAATADAEPTSSDGPLSVFDNRLGALREKHNRILKMEESVAQGKSLNKVQEEVLRSKPVVAAVIKGLEMLRQPLSSAVSEEIQLALQGRTISPDETTSEAQQDKSEVSEQVPNEPDRAIEDLLNLLYFGSLFDVKSRRDLTSTMLTRTHERGCCLTYDKSTDDATDLLSDKDLDLISFMSGLLTSRPADSSFSHKDALHRCLHHAKLWLSNSDQPIDPTADVSYAGLRERLIKIMALYTSFQVPGVPISVPVQVENSVGQSQQQLTADAAATSSDGPLHSFFKNRIRTLCKKHNRIIQMEEFVAQGKSLNKEQKEVLPSKPTVAALINELEMLQQRFSSSLSKEISLALQRQTISPDETTSEAQQDKSEASEQVPNETDRAIEDLLNLLYFGSLFDVKSERDLTSTMLTRTHERGCCLTYDKSTDDATDLLSDKDLDLISFVSGLLTSRPADSSFSHKDALHRCLHHAKLWLSNSDQPIDPTAGVSYAGLRERLNKIMALYTSFQVPGHGVPISVPVQVEDSVGQSQQQNNLAKVKVDLDLYIFALIVASSEVDAAETMIRAILFLSQFMRFDTSLMATGETSTPSLVFLVLERDGFSIWSGPHGKEIFFSEEHSKVSCTNVEFIRFSEDGSRFMVVVSDSSIIVYDSTTWKELRSFPINALHSELSPLGTYLQTFEASEAYTTEHGNVVLWEIETGKAVTRQFQTEMPNGTCSDEVVACRLAPNVRIDFFDGTDFSKGIIYQLDIHGVVRFELSKKFGSHVAAYVSECEEEDWRDSVQIYACKKLQNQLLPRHNIDHHYTPKQMKWNNGSTHFLLVIHPVDERITQLPWELSYLTINIMHGVKVPLDVVGPIFDVQWSYSGNEFAVLYGFSSDRCATVFDKEGKRLNDVKDAFYSTIQWSPKGNFLCLAGFGSTVSNGMLFWDYKEESVNNIVETDTGGCSVYTSGWSACGRFFMIADRSCQCYKIYDYTGKLIRDVKNRVGLLQVDWKPKSPNKDDEIATRAKNEQGTAQPQSAKLAGASVTATGSVVPCFVFIGSDVPCFVFVEFQWFCLELDD